MEVFIKPGRKPSETVKKMLLTYFFKTLIQNRVNTSKKYTLKYNECILKRPCNILQMINFLENFIGEKLLFKLSK